MKPSKNLTYVPLAKISENKRKDLFINLCESGKKFLNNKFTGDSSENFKGYIHLKHGIPNIVNKWAETFGLNLVLSGEYAVVALLNIKMEWNKKASETNFLFNKTSYQAGIHNSAYETNIDNLYNIPTKNKDIQCLVSQYEIDLDLVNKSIERTKKMDLQVPLIKLDITEELTHIFQGTSIETKNQKYECSEVKVITKFDMGLVDAEVKQVASMVFLTSSMHPYVERKNIIIDNPFYVYIKVNDRLAFSCYVSTDSFISKK